METPVQTTEERPGRKPDRKLSSRPYGRRADERRASCMQQTCISAALTPDDEFTYVFRRRFVDVSVN
jgi:hypothetical protein